MKKLLIIALIVLFVPSLSAAPINKKFDTIVTFGDSLSDNGNLYRYMLHFLPASPPYFEGRFSNGPVWVEQLYQAIFKQEDKGMQDYAVGGAGAVLSMKENLPFTLGLEVDDYYYWHSYDHVDTSLYIVWIGSNNYLNGPLDVEKITTKVINAISTNIESLIEHGGNKFMLVGLPDLGATPEAVELGRSELLHQLSLTHNNKLKNLYHQLGQKHPDITMVYFDVNQLFNELVTNPQKYGINNTTEPCYLGSYSGWLLPQQLNPSNNELLAYLKQNQSKQYTALNPQALLQSPQLKEAIRVSYTASEAQKLGLNASKEPLQCDGYLFWDHVHPSQATHTIIANRAMQLINQAGLEHIPSK